MPLDKEGLLQITHLNPVCSLIVTANQFSNEGLAWTSILVNVCLVGEDHHSPLASTQHDIHSPLVLKESKVSGSDQGNDDIILLITYPHHQLSA